MLKRTHRIIAALGLLLSLTVSGVALAMSCYSGNCNNSVSGCERRDMTVYNQCCMDFDQDNIYHCITCTRHLYFCSDIVMYMYGPVETCTNPTNVCNP